MLACSSIAVSGGATTTRGEIRKDDELTAAVPAYRDRVHRTPRAQDARHSELLSLIPMVSSAASRRFHFGINAH